MNNFSKFDTSYFWKIFNETFHLNRTLLSEANLRSHDLIFGVTKLFDLKKIPTGSKVFDWEVPKAWHLNNFTFENEYGESICSLSESYLHVMTNSISINGVFSFEEIKNNLYSLPEIPDAIPYLTTYYGKNWGICLKDSQLKKLDPKLKYKIIIDTSFSNGNLLTSEYIKRGFSDKEILFTSYLCHPSMANNELVAPILLSMIAQYLERKNTYWSYRIIVSSETLGSIAYLSKFFNHLKNNTKAGFTLSCFGDKNDFSVVNSPYGNNVADKIIKNFSHSKNIKLNSYDWLSRGSDERQFCSPNIELPFCTICRSKFGEYPEYHTSLDNKDLIDNNSLSQSFNFLINLIEYIEKSRYPKSTISCEPFMTKYNLYPTIGYLRGRISTQDILDVHSYCDGNNNMDDLVSLLKKSKDQIGDLLDILISNNLVVYE